MRKAHKEKLIKAAKIVGRIALEAALIIICNKNKKGDVVWKKKNRL